MRLDALTSDDMDRVRTWRNQVPYALRTTYLLTPDQQLAFYRDIVCDSRSPHRYWALRDGDALVGMGGFTYIEAANARAEISLIIDPARSGVGLGHQAVPLLLAEGFGNLGLETITAEVYASNPRGDTFWADVLAPYQPDVVVLPRRKRWAGTLWSSRYFTVTVEGWAAARGAS